MPLLSWFRARHSPDISSRPALFDAIAGRWCTYAELDEHVARAAQPLRTGQKQLAFVFCRNDLRSAVDYLAALEAGHAVALLSADADAAALAGLVQRYQPDFLLGNAPAGLTASGDATAQGIAPDLAVLLTTSGSTGNPKLVRLSEANVRSNATGIAAALAIDPSQRAAANLPIHYSFGLSVLNSHLAAGASVLLTDESVMSDKFWALVRSESCTSLSGVPYSYQMLRRLDLDRLDVPSIDTMTQAGGRLDPKLVEHFHGVMARRGGRFFVMYGQTEATARMTILPADSLPAKLGAVGLPLPGGKLAIERMGDSAEDGEVVYTGPNVMMGYAESREDLARGDECQGTLRTGDLGYIDGDGALYITGRMKRIGKVYGYRINLDDVEVLAGSLIGSTVVVVAGDDKLVLYRDLAAKTGLADDALRKELATRLKVHPTAIEVRAVETLPRLGNGKIDYQRLVTQR